MKQSKERACVESMVWKGWKCRQFSMARRFLWRSGTKWNFKRWGVGSWATMKDCGRGRSWRTSFSSPAGVRTHKWTLMDNWGAKKYRRSEQKILREILYQVYKMLEACKFVSKMYIIHLPTLLVAREIHGKTTETQFSTTLGNIFVNELTTLC